MNENSLEAVKQKFLTYFKDSGRADLTVINYERALRYFYAFLKQDGVGDIKNVTQNTMQRYQDYVYKTLDHSEYTLRFYISEIRTFFGHLIKMGIIYDNPALNMQIEQKKVESIEVISRYYSLEEIIAKYRHYLKEKDVSFVFYERERVSINTFILFLEKEKVGSIYKVTSEMIEKYKSHLNSLEYQGGKNLNIYDQVEKLRSLRRFYKWLIKEKMLKDDPTAYLRIGEHLRLLKNQNSSLDKAIEKPSKSELQLYQDKFLEYKQSLGFSLETSKRLRIHLNILIRFLHSRDIQTPKTVKKEDILCYLNYLSNEYKTISGGRLAQGTKSGLIGTAKQLFSFLARFEYIQKDPALTIDSLKSDSGIPRTLMSEREINILLDMPDLTKPIGIRDKAMLETFYSTGMRASELSHLTKEDIDFTQGLIRINYPKGGRPQQRIVPIGKIALEYITLYLTKARDYLMNGVSDILFLSKSGSLLIKLIMAL